MLNGGSFSWRYYPIPYPNPVTWKVVAYWGGVNDPAQTWSSSLQNLIFSKYSTPLDTFIVIIFLLVGIAAGARTEGTHKLSNTCFIEAFMVFFLFMVGLTSWLGIALNGAVIFFLFLIGILGHSREGGTNIMSG